MWSEAGEEVAAQFAGRPWEQVDATALGAASAVPTMLSEPECQAYHWVGAHAEGLGATVDLGAFAGGSAARLLSGLERSGHPFHLHAFDRFTADPRTQRHFLKEHLTPCDATVNILPLAQSLLAPWAPQVTFLDGDMTRRHWQSGPIEILAYDAGKNATTTDHIAAQFLPALIPGRSLILHQDYLLPSVPWLAAQSALLARHLRPLARVGRDCMVFLWTSPIAEAGVRAARVADLSDQKLIQQVRKAGEALADFAEFDLFKTMIQRIKANPGARADWQLKLQT